MAGMASRKRAGAWLGWAWQGVVTVAPPPASRKRAGAWLDREGRRVAPGDAVLVAGQRQGRARFYGRTDFAPGYWFGVELDSAGGKHDGSVFGVRYFTCPPKHGVFAPPSRVQRVGGPKEEPGDGSSEKKGQPVTVSQPKRFPAVRTPKDITSESSFSRLLFCCWFPWMLRPRCIVIDAPKPRPHLSPAQGVSPSAPGHAPGRFPPSLPGSRSRPRPQAWPRPFPRSGSEPAPDRRRSRSRSQCSQ
ncbi:CAP-Gly domain-containing linker protein 3-like [Vidua chalybeata]|uniref:CAP-Gly domain-containing linker protein 3-like n=1 Tax=Vidua chalybeata TaxID=81927 RepID=UPI0023A8F6BB|nr:CAP-Gly domain-containing linker protein 3-like [Vidua chalybeata]